MLICSFCGKNQKEVSKLIAGNEGVHICDRCVTLSNDLLNKEVKQKSEKDKAQKIKDIFKTIKPKEVMNILNEHVIGQQQAKKTVSVAIYNHCKRILNSSDIKIQKSNILMIGPTGVGKTLIAQVLADILDVPFVITDATTLTESGYAGDDAEILIEKLLISADYDISKAEVGIIYVDEIDKKAKRNDYVNLSRDVSGEGVQQSLLKLMEGTKVNIPDRKSNSKFPQFHEIDTTNILFIVSGAFVGLDDVVSERNNDSRIGFSQNKKKQKNDNLNRKLVTKDLIKYGLIPEFVGRLPNVTVLDDLSKEQLKLVLTQPKNSVVKQFEELFKVEGVELKFDEDAMDTIVEIAMEQQLGARGLRKIVEESLLDTQFDLPEMAEKGVREILITKDTVNNKISPWFVTQGESIH